MDVWRPPSVGTGLSGLVIRGLEGRSSRARHDPCTFGRASVDEHTILLIAVGGLMIFVLWAFIKGLLRTDPHP